MTDISPILVTGMHRGGTSAISKVLANLGVDTGPKEGLIGASDSNRHGHYEVRKIVDLNDRMLEDLGGSWLSPPSNFEELVNFSEGPYKEIALDVIGRHFGDRPWFIKDPRFCLLLPFWRSVLPSSPLLIVVVRSTDSIAHSLYQRDGIPIEFGQKLAATYLELLVRGSQNLQSLVVGYEEALRDPKNLVELLTEFLSNNNVEQLNGIDEALVSLDQSDNHYPDVQLSEEQIRWHGKPLPKVFKSEGVNEDSLILAPALAASIRNSGHYRGIAEERKRELLEVSEEFKKQIASLHIQRDKALSEVEYIRAFRAAEVSSTTYQIVALITRTGARLAPQSSRRRTFISFLLREGRRIYSFMRKMRSTKRGRFLKNFKDNVRNEKKLKPVHFEMNGVSPVATVVIPVHGEIAFTARCLHSISAAKNEVTFQVIVVDDASTDGTDEYLQACSGVTVISNIENQGYLRSTNLGASSTDTDIVILLNNDTEVSDGWIDEFVSTFDQYPEAGVVGSRLIYPDGRLQEAGGIIFQDGTAWNYGRFQDPSAEEFNFVREVDYCSAACIAVRTKLWEEIGGFDEQFVPAYYEDVDLAFESRLRGWKVLYQPNIPIIHYEGISHGKDENSGLKAHQRKNHDVFVDKWSSELQTHLPNNRDNVFFASNRKPHGRVFVADYEVPHWDRHAGALRMSRILRILAELGWQVTFAPGNGNLSEPYTSELRQQGIEIVRILGSEQLYLESKGKATFDAAILSRPEDGSRWLSVFRTCSPKTKIIYDTVDLHTIRMERGRVLGRNDQSLEAEKRIAALEQELIQASDLTLVVSPEEKKWINEKIPSSKVEVIGTVHSEEQSKTKYEDREGLLFIGSWNHFPNRDAIEFLLGEIAPSLWERFPGLLIHLVGSDIPASIGGGEKRIISHGWVEDVSKLYDQVKISIAPLRYGAGLKGKVGESLCRGIPVVGTSIAFEGFDLGAYLDKTRSDSSEGLVEAISQVYGDKLLWTALASSGREKVLEILGEDQTSINLQSILRASD